MKKIYIVAFLAIAAGIVMLVTASKDVSTYATFETALRDGNRVKVVGKLAKDKEMVYNPSEDANLFTFFLTDNNGEEKQISYLGAKPQDFEMSEQVVITGQFNNDVFVADELLMKCPSKYKGEEELVNAQNNG